MNKNNYELRITNFFGIKKRQWGLLRQMNKNNYKLRITNYEFFWDKKETIGTVKTNE